MNEYIKIGAVALIASFLGGFVAGMVGGNQPAVNLGAQSHTNSGFVINEDGTDDDTRIEGDTDANLLYIDAGNDCVAIGASSCTNKLEITGAFSSATTSVGNLIYGTGIFSTSTTGTLTEVQLRSNSGIYITATGAGQGTLSLTLPATSTMTTLIDTAGSCQSWWIDASDVAAATTTTIVAGTGWNLVGLDATGAGTGADVIDGAEYGKLTACRETDDDVVGYIEEWLAAD